MKKLVVTCLLLLSALHMGAADQVVKSNISLTWRDPNPPGFVTGYNIVRKVGENWVRLATTTNTNWKVVGLEPGRHTIAVTAAVGELESDVSNTVDLLRILAVIDVQLEQ